MSAPKRSRPAPRGKASAPAGVTLEELRVEPGPPVRDSALPSAAIVILNYEGLRHLDGCFASLRALDYPAGRFEVVLVDNGSTDGSQAAVRERHPWVRLVENSENRGFAAACNQGAAQVGAEVVVFLNNDMRVEPGWLRELVAPLARGECRMTTAKMLSWDGKLINSAGGGVNFHGIGIQHGYLREPAPEHDVPRKSLFACGGAMASERATFLELGGFDEEFFAYYEDVDLGWRAWVAGHEVHYAPKAVCYHHHSSTSKTFPLETVRLLQVRNPLLACVKNYDDANLARVLPALLGLFLRRMLLVSGIADDAPYRIQRVPRGQTRARAGESDWRRFLRGALAGVLGKAGVLDPARTEVTKVLAADLIGANDLLGNWEHWMRRRSEVQSRRRRADQEVFRLFLKPMWCIEDDPAYRALHAGLARLTGVAELFAGLELPGAEPHR
jgi:GT2 family glycosyltransferase